MKNQRMIKQKQVPFFDHCFDKTRLKKWIAQLYYETTCTEDLTILNFVEALKTIGFQEATRAGVSIGIDDLKIPPKKAVLFKEIEYEIDKTTQAFALNRLTALENFQSFIDIWHKTSELIKMEVVSNFEKTDILNPVYMMAFSGARGNLSQVSQLVGMRGFMSDPEGQIIDYPIRSNFREGLTLTEYVISCYGARKGLVDTALRTADAGYLTRRLVDVAHSVIITRFDCKTTQGIWLSAIEENSQIVYPLEKRLVGRVLADNIYFPFIEPETKQNQMIQWSYFQKNQQLDSINAKLLAKCFTRVLIRSPLRCLKKKRLCQLCYGWTLPHAYLAPIGEAVGILAAQSIGEPGTQLTMRTFHTGGVFSGALSEEIKAPYSGTIHYKQPVQGALFRSSNGQLAFRTRQPGFFVLEPLTNNNHDKPFELHFPATSILFRKNDEKIIHGDVLIELPKDQEVGKETILNTYTYYSKRSGILQVYKTSLFPFENYNLITHPKLPKIEPFYIKAQSINRTFHSFKIYAGQIFKSYQIQKILPQPGDLVNTQSLIYSTKLHFDSKTTLSFLPGIAFESTKITPGKNSMIKSFNSNSNMTFSKEKKMTISNISTKISIFDLPLSNLKYSKKFGYISYFKQPVLNQKIQFLISSFQQNLLPNHRKPAMLFHQAKTKAEVVGRGKFIYPFIFSKLNWIYTKSILEQQFYDEQIQITPKISFLKLTQLIQQNLLPKQSDLNQICFYISEPKYQSFDTISQQKRFEFLETSENQVYKYLGRVLSKYKSSKLNLNLKDKVKLDWKTRPEIVVLLQQQSLNKNKTTKIFQKDGFFIQKSLNKQNDLKRYNKKTSHSNIYWQVQNRYVFKTGWPIYSQFQKLNDELQNQFHYFGQNIVSDILFLTNCKYTQYLLQPNREFEWASTSTSTSTSTSSIWQKLNKKQIFRKKTIMVFEITKFHFPILLIRPIQEFSLTGIDTDTTVKLYKKQFYKDSYFENWKQIQQLFISTKTRYKKEKLTTILTHLNKQVCTTNKAIRLDQNRFSLKIQAQNVLNLNDFNHSTSVKSTHFYEKDYSMNQTLIYFILTLDENLFFSNQSQYFGQDFDFVQGEFKNTVDIFDRKYSYGLVNKVIEQHFFKNESDSLYMNLANSTIESHKFCPYVGELALNVTNKADEISSLILTSKDTYTIPIDGLKRKMEIGDYIYSGLPITSTQTIQYTGQVIQIQKNHIKIQLIENSLVASNSRFFCHNNQLIEKTSQIFTQSYPRLQMGDIVQGIPKIEEFFEARQTKDGNPFNNNLHKRLKRRFQFYRKNCRYPLFIAARKSIYDIQNLIIDSIFKLYSSQGIDISDKHLEIIVRQMTSKVKVTQFWKFGTPFVPFQHPLPTELYSRHYIERYQYRKKNTRMYNVRYEPAILGITRAALENDGFISAASFQETTRILSRGAIFQKNDYLKGLKENVILGHIIPAGTAVRTYSRRFKPPLMQDILAKQTLQILTINHEWKTAMVDSTTVSSQYLNPIRHQILECLCLEYFKMI